MNLTAQEAALAWAQGKKVEAIEDESCNWRTIASAGTFPVGSMIYAAAFNAPGYTFRIAPEPKLRPMTIEEWKGKVGQVVRHKDDGETRLVCGTAFDTVMVYTEGRYVPSDMLTLFTFLDGSPCGVMEGGAQ